LRLRNNIKKLHVTSGVDGVLKLINWHGIISKEKEDVRKMKNRYSKEINIA
jgi:hypothetical protein